MLLLLKSFLDTIKQAMNTYETKLNKQLETTVVTDTKHLKKASNITEEILIITDKYVNWFSKRDVKEYIRLKKKFLKVN